MEKIHKYINNIKKSYDKEFMFYFVFLLYDKVVFKLKLIITILIYLVILCNTDYLLFTFYVHLNIKFEFIILIN